jgi:hypothetical protein
MEDVIAFYEKTAGDCRLKSSRLQKLIHSLGTARLLIVIAAIATVWALWNIDRMALGGIIAAFIIPFIVLMIQHDRLAKRKAHCETLEQLCRNEIRGIAGDYSSFDGAPEYIDGDHPFSLDLDIFGDHSIFQSLNRTVTAQGKNSLAALFNNPPTGKDIVLLHQEAIRELSALVELRQSFCVEGLLSLSNAKEKDMQASQPAALGNIPHFGNKFWKAAAIILPVLWIFMVAGAATSFISWNIIGYFFLVSAFIAFFKVKTINRMHGTINRMEKILLAYSRLMKIIEETSFSAHMLASIRKSLTAHGITASQSIRRLSSFIGVLDQRGTLTGALLNIFTLRDIRACISIEKWIAHHGSHSEAWIESIATFDAFSSLAGFAYNHPDYTYPHLVGSFRLSAKEVGHPLIPVETCVRNDIRMERRPIFMIVTGANMAGKSTYLRTIGVNFILACIGVPVCAKSMEFYPTKLMTGLRTTDSLSGNTSYFMAELMRLKKIVESALAGEEVFVILDEILKGTNSVDKQKGSYAFIQKLLDLNVSGIIATHDLALASLRDKFPDNVEACCFEAEIDADSNLSFSYLLRNGVAANMNATILMRKMGITE